MLTRDSAILTRGGGSYSAPAPSHAGQCELNPIVVIMPSAVAFIMRGGTSKAVGLFETRPPSQRAPVRDDDYVDLRVAD